MSARAHVALVVSLALAVTVLGTAVAGAATRPLAPPIGGLTLEGKRLTLASFRGRPVLINVWSSW